MTLTYDDIKDMVSNNKTPSEIATLLNNDFRHVFDTNSDAVFRLLVNEYFVMRKDHSTGIWTGGIVSAINSSGNQEVIIGFDRLISQPWSKESIIRCSTDSNIGKLTTAITEIAKTVINADPTNTFTSSQVQKSMDLLTGGRRFGSVTESEVSSLISEQNSLNAVDNLNSLWLQQMNDAGINSALAVGSVSSLVSALRAAANNIEGV